MTPARSTVRFQIAALLAFTGLATAQPASETDEKNSQPPEEITNARESGPSFAASLSGWYGFETDLDVGPGDLSIARARLDLSMTITPAERTLLTFGIEVEESWYDFNNASGLDASGDPFDNATNVDFFARYVAPMNDTTNYFVLGSVGFAAESGADFGESLIYGAGAGFVTRQSSTFSWGLGVLVRTRLEDDALVIPIPQITWNISDRWTLASQRAGLRLEYAANESLTYGIGAQFDSRTFRLDEDGVIPSGVATDRRIPVAFFVEYAPEPNFTIGGQVGASLFNNIELFDSAGNDIIDDDVDPGVFIGINGRIRF
ncbi:MAG: DUF6268 family outer membrane beta-barrel protein [Phycisphaerales bacterium]